MPQASTVPEVKFSMTTSAFSASLQNQILALGFLDINADEIFALD